MGEQKKKIEGWGEKGFRGLIYALPAVLFFSYYPLMHFGADGTMNYEISLPLVWLVVFDVWAVAMMVRRHVLFAGWKRAWWLWALFPVWLTLTVIWSENPVRGLLTVGIWWLVMLAGYAMWRLRGLFNEGAQGRFWRWFFGASLVACAWCVVQCVLDLVGVGRDYSLMCEGCTYRMFGFPHPNGLAIEPQFMGNLLLAPAIMSAWMMMSKHGRRPLLIVAVFFIFSATLFLTFSRGAIYAFGVAMVVMSVWIGVRNKTWRVLQIWGIVAAAFVLTLNMQGLMAQVSPTRDTYVDGVAKVLNHLSLGMIEIRGNNGGGCSEGVVENSGGDSIGVVENFGEDGAIGGGGVGDDGGRADVVNVGEGGEADVGEDAAFNGYVAESTEARLRLTNAAIEVWRQSPSTMLVGVGLGGAGWALYNNGLSPAPKEIVQNEYASLLLETGLVGISLLVLTVVLIVQVIRKSSVRVAMVCLMMAYGVTLCFFSGLPNALHIFLLPVAIMTIGCGGKVGIKKSCKKHKDYDMIET